MSSHVYHLSIKDWLTVINCLIGESQCSGNLEISITHDPVNSEVFHILLTILAVIENSFIALSSYEKSKLEVVYFTKSSLKENGHKKLSLLEPKVSCIVVYRWF